MNSEHRAFRSVGLLIGAVALVLVTGCAPVQTRNDGYGQGNAAAANDSPCNTGAATAIGALAGALLGKGKGHLVGAAIGAGIGALACTAFNYHARKVRDAKAVEAEYLRQQRALPATNTVSSYSSALEPSATVKAGSGTTLQSSIVVLDGTQDAAPQLAEKLTLVSPEGKELTTVTKHASDINGTGEYQTNFQFSLPKGIENGRYTVRSTLYMNDKPVGKNEVPMLVVS